MATRAHNILRHIEHEAEVLRKRLAELDCAMVKTREETSQTSTEQGFGVITMSGNYLVIDEKLRDLIADSIAAYEDTITPTISIEIDGVAVVHDDEDNGYTITFENFAAIEPARPVTFCRNTEGVYFSYPTDLINHIRATVEANRASGRWMEYNYVVSDDDIILIAHSTSIVSHAFYIDAFYL